MKREWIYVVLVGILALMIALAWWGFGKADKTPWDVCYSITNRNIEWTGAGYNGINGR